MSETLAEFMVRIQDLVPERTTVRQVGYDNPDWLKPRLACSHDGSYALVGDGEPMVSEDGTVTYTECLLLICPPMEECRDLSMV